MFIRSNDSKLICHSENKYDVKVPCLLIKSFYLGKDFPGESHPDKCPCVDWQEKEKLDRERLERRR